MLPLNCMKRMLYSLWSCVLSVNQDIRTCLWNVYIYVSISWATRFRKFQWMCILNVLFRFDCIQINYEHTRSSSSECWSAVRLQVRDVTFDCSLVFWQQRSIRFWWVCWFRASFTVFWSSIRVRPISESRYYQVIFHTDFSMTWCQICKKTLQVKRSFIFQAKLDWKVYRLTEI